MARGIGRALLAALASLVLPASAPAASFTLPGGEGIGLGADGSIWTGDLNNQRFLHYSADGRTLYNGWVNLTGPGAALAASAVAPGGNMVVADGRRGVALITPAGGFVRWVTTQPARDVAVDGAGNVYLADGQPKLEKVPLDGSAPSTLADPGYGFVAVDGVAYDPGTGDVYAVDSVAGRVTELRPDGSIARTYGAGALTAPNDVAIGRGGITYVSQAARPRLKRFDAAGNETGSYDRWADTYPQTWLAGGGNTLLVAGGGVTVVDIRNPVVDVRPYYPYIYAGTLLHFTVTASLPFDRIVRYQWDFDGDGTFDVDGSSPEAERRFVEPVDQPVAVRVTASDGATNTLTQTIRVHAAGATVSATPASVLTGRPTTLEAGPNPPESRIESADWDLDGDGRYDRTTDGPVTEAVYATPGTRTVRVRLNRAGGARDEQTTTVAVHPAPPAGRVGVTINGGDAYTNDPKVVLDVVWPAGADRITTSADGGFKAARTVPLAEHVAFTLDEGRGERLPKVAYIRFDGSDQTFQDDIVLDQTAPAVQSADVAPAGGARAASRHRYRLRLRATDRTSGVASVQLATRRSKPARARRYHRTLTVTGATRPVWVRVRDRAGNDSRWRRLSVRR